MSCQVFMVGDGGVRRALFYLISIKLIFNSELEPELDLKHLGTARFYTKVVSYSDPLNE